MILFCCMQRNPEMSGKVIEAGYMCRCTFILIHNDAVGFHKYIWV